MQRVFPPNIQQLQGGIYSYRRAKDHAPHEDPYPYDDIQGALRGQEFVANGNVWRITGVVTHEIAPPLYDHGDVEFNPYLLIPPLAGGVGAYAFLGKGKEFKVPGDASGTQGSRASLRYLYASIIIGGGEGSGKDGNKQDAAFFRGEPAGLGHGTQIVLFNDPWEGTEYARKKDRAGGYKGVGVGWAPDLVDPANWYPGYSGSMSLQLAVNAEQKMPAFLSDKVYFDKRIAPYKVSKRGLNFDHSPQDMVNIVSSALDIEPRYLRAAALARARHMNTMKGWIHAGMQPWNIFTPSDGDATLAPAISAGAIHFGGLTGGTMEGLIGAALGIPLGVRTFLQPVSHDCLGEHKDESDLLREDHRFNFSEAEYDELYDTHFYDSQHIGHALRRARRNGSLMSAVRSMIYLAGLSEQLTEAEVNEFRNTLEAVLEEKGDARFNDRQRTLLKKTFKEQGFIDVRKTLTFEDLVPTRDWQYVGTAITPLQWAPLEGIRTRNNRMVVDTLVVGGSNAVYIVETELQDLGPIRK